MSKKKEPFVSYTVDEVLASEAENFVIQVGSEMYNSKGTWAFSKRSAITHYNKILRILLDQMQNGSRKDKKNAKRVLENFKILPLRLH